MKSILIPQVEIAHRALQPLRHIETGGGPDVVIVAVAFRVAVAPEHPLRKLLTVIRCGIQHSALSIQGLDWDAVLTTEC